MRRVAEVEPKNRDRESLLSPNSLCPTFGSALPAHKAHGDSTATPPNGKQAVQSLRTERKARTTTRSFPLDTGIKIMSMHCANLCAERQDAEAQFWQRA